jgi:hypothetical protein
MKNKKLMENKKSYTEEFMDIVTSNCASSIRKNMENMKIKIKKDLIKYKAPGLTEEDKKYIGIAILGIALEKIYSPIEFEPLTLEEWDAVPTSN